MPVQRRSSEGAAEMGRMPRSVRRRNRMRRFIAVEVSVVERGGKAQLVELGGGGSSGLIG
jgi:hypothetical protein